MLIEQRCNELANNLDGISIRLRIIDHSGWSNEISDAISNILYDLKNEYKSCNKIWRDAHSAGIQKIKEKNCCTCETVGNAGGMPKGWKKCPIHGKNKEEKDLHPSDMPDLMNIQMGTCAKCGRPLSSSNLCEYCIK